MFTNAREHHAKTQDYFSFCEFFVLQKMAKIVKKVLGPQKKKTLGTLILKALDSRDIALPAEIRRTYSPSVAEDLTVSHSCLARSR